MPASFPTGSSSACCAVVTTEDTPGVFTGDLDINNVRYQIRPMNIQPWLLTVVSGYEEIERGTA
jgi:hypothetical protein